MDGDGWLDLYVGTFHGAATDKPNLLFRNEKGKFTLDDQKALRMLEPRHRRRASPTSTTTATSTCTSAACRRPKAEASRGCALFRNDGGGKFTDISKDSGACPAAFGGRSAAVLDFDGDGLLDLLVGEDPIPGYNGSKTQELAPVPQQGQACSSRT